MSSILRRAVVLLSGGLDSLLAARVILDQGIYVEGLHFYTGFCVEGLTHAIRHPELGPPKKHSAQTAADQLGIRLHVIDIAQTYKEIVLHPRHGYGANLNPCIDCKTFMVRRALAWIQENEFDFLVTGEVVGQRPMSQKKESLRLISHESGAEDRLLRPLSAKNLPVTLPEREGWVNRNNLYSFSGRSRKPQIALAAHYQIKDYAQPAGGCCFLTDATYSSKLADLWKFRGKRDYDLDDLFLLKVGRHLRPFQNFKLIIGRNEGENSFLEGYRKCFIHFRTVSCLGPLVLVDGTFENTIELEIAARLVARFSKGKEEDIVTVECTYLDGSSVHLQVKPLASEEIPQDWYL